MLRGLASQHATQVGQSRSLRPSRFPFRAGRPEVSVWGLSFGREAGSAGEQSRFPGGPAFSDRVRCPGRGPEGVCRRRYALFSRGLGMAPRRRGGRIFDFRARGRAQGRKGCARRPVHGMEGLGRGGGRGRGGPRGRWLASSVSTPPQCGHGGGPLSGAGRSPK